jgi:acyl-ACP thioesterase
MLAQTRAQILRWPTFWNRVKVTTWPSEMGRLLSRREFVLVDEEDNLLLTATTLWAFMDTARRKVTRIPPEVANVYQVFEDRALFGPFRGPAAVVNPGWTARFPIRRWQIDFNGHVNNLRYLDWMLETVPDEIWKDYQVRDLNIRYQKEAGPGVSVLARSGELDSGQDGLRRLAHEVLLEGRQDSVAVAETTWAPRRD